MIWKMSEGPFQQYQFFWPRNLLFVSSSYLIRVVLIKNHVYFRDHVAIDIGCSPFHNERTKSRTD